MAPLHIFFNVSKYLDHNILSPFFIHPLFNCNFIFLFPIHTFVSFNKRLVCVQIPFQIQMRRTNDYRRPRVPVSAWISCSVSIFI